ncbi:MAG: DNA-processing protein DprA [Fimbriimonadaceae bacterium]|nr:DNA-processing protein DprA [Fimbriimonadaceae bacterium]QYK56138.1 MAG: DNA-processing protein DprA [Fimbriimonadaceae bacterium]
MSGERLGAEAVLAALYLRGAPHSQPRARRRWPLVRAVLLGAPGPLGSVGASLRGAGLFEEAWCLAQSGALGWGVAQVESRRCLTAASLAFPSRWESVLGDAAPPCFWVRGAWPAAPSVSVAGSRTPSPRLRALCRGLGAALLAEGRALVSGGAAGVDSLVAGATLLAGGEGRVVEILPCGLDSAPGREGACQVSLCAPGAGFSTGQAMERNLLLYAASSVSLVLGPRFRAGGSWAGATECLRRRASRLAVGAGAGADGRRAAQALVALGAAPFASLADLPSLLALPDPRWGLFSDAEFGVSEPRRPYRAYRQPQQGRAA